jgi:hypothetical protein
MKHSLQPLIMAITPLIQGICFYKQDVVPIKEHEEKGRLTAIVEPNMADLPLLIGTAGRQSKALCYLFQRYGEINGFNAGARIEESFKGRHEPPCKPKNNPDFNIRSTCEILEGLVALLVSTPYKIHTEETGNEVRFYIQFNPEHEDSESMTVTALGDLFYPYGKSKGRRVIVKIHGWIKTNQNETSTPNIGKPLVA